MTIGGKRDTDTKDPGQLNTDSWSKLFHQCTKPECVEIIIYMRETEWTRINFSKANFVHFVSSDVDSVENLQLYLLNFRFTWHWVDIAAYCLPVDVCLVIIYIYCVQLFIG